MTKDLIKVPLVLLVDDDASSNYLATEMLSQTGMVEDIVATTSAREALDYLANALDTGRGIPDLIFLDLNMPGLNGWDFVESYKEMAQRIPLNACELVVLTSSYSTKDLIKGSVHPEVIYYINKPLDDGELRTLLRGKIERKTVA